jgi:hypothetical protein
MKTYKQFNNFRLQNQYLFNKNETLKKQFKDNSSESTSEDEIIFQLQNQIENFSHESTNKDIIISQLKKNQNKYFPCQQS